MPARLPNLFDSKIITKAPVALALVALLVGGVFLLARSDAQARDTIRKHHLADLEQGLYLARTQHGTYPPYDQATWCGLLNDPKNASVKSEIETALRQRIDKYGNLEKPFPTDPKALTRGYDYFYWKRSPAMFELYAVLEADKNGTRNTLGCPNSPALYFDYGLNSIVRENQPL